MSRYYFIVSMIIILAGTIVGQESIQSTFVLPQTKGVIYNREHNIDLRLNTNGYTLGLTKGKIKTFYKTSTFFFDITLHKDPRENRQNNKVIFARTNETSTPFVYGKVNSLYSLKAGKGIKRYWSDKASKRGVMVGYIVEGGLTLGILQPYYLKVAEIDAETGLPSLKEITYSGGNEAKYLDNSRIFGRSNIFKGILESTLVPGVHFQTGIHCDFGKYDNFIKALEVGTMINVFTQPIELMVNQPKRPFLVNFYLSLQFGKRV
ncbi:MAG: hypothetical protein IPM04_05820 [Saprospiraceae bacterium]|nr:hypothetical protein [Candidatus Brachybacter algidus]MBK8747381.1 hypothetical protein [Candidatus Brachybacter algidus]MBL0120370.1 hypothetical protein [Candidatus Brachybacter algidus]